MHCINEKSQCFCLLIHWTFAEISCYYSKDFPQTEFLINAAYLLFSARRPSWITPVYAQHSGSKYTVHECAHEMLNSSTLRKPIGITQHVFHLLMDLNTLNMIQKNTCNNLSHVIVSFLSILHCKHYAAYTEL